LDVTPLVVMLSTMHGLVMKAPTILSKTSPNQTGQETGVLTTQEQKTGCIGYSSTHKEKCQEYK
jgi:hypothetical protein